MHDQGPNTAYVDMGPGIGYRQLGKALEIELLMAFNMAHNHVQPPPSALWICYAPSKADLILQIMNGTESHVPTL